MTEHNWTKADPISNYLRGTEVCSVCLVVRRRDDKNSTCKGPSELRIDEDD